MISKARILSLFLLSVFLVSAIFPLVYMSHVSGEDSPLVLYDDNTGFWLARGGGVGNIGASIGSSAYPVRAGSNSLLINLTEGEFQYIQVGHDFGSIQNWADYSGLSFWFYGSLSNKAVNLALAAPDSSNQFFVSFNDNFTGWKNLVFPKESLIRIGNPSFSNVTIIAFFFYNAPTTFYIDRLILGTEQLADITPTPQTSTTTVPSTPYSSGMTPLPSTSGSTSAVASSSPSTIVTGSAKPSSSPSVDWFGQNWRWILLIVAILVVLLIQVVYSVLKKKRFSRKIS